VGDGQNNAIEVHRSLSQVDEIQDSGVAASDPLPDQTDRILIATWSDIPGLDWAVVDKALHERSGVPVQITCLALPLD